MKASAWSNGNGSYGLRVGAPSRTEFFRPEWIEVLLEIRGQDHRVEITPGFWHPCPELRSPIIRDWLQEHRALDWPKGRPPTVELAPLGDNRFRVGP